MALIEERRPGKRQIRIYAGGWGWLTRYLRDDAFGFYVMLVLHSEADPVIPPEVVRHFAGRKKRRFLRELSSDGLTVADEANGSLRLYEPKPADDRWRYFGDPVSHYPFVMMALAASPDRAPLSPKIKQQVLTRDGRVCGICGRSIAPSEGLDIDHIIPVARGGGDELINLQPAHSSCNRSKGARILVGAE